MHSAGCPQSCHLMHLKRAGPITDQPTDLPACLPSGIHPAQDLKCLGGPGPYYINLWGQCYSRAISTLEADYLHQRLNNSEIYLFRNEIVYQGCFCCL
jgi:hypothetical protein